MNIYNTIIILFFLFNIKYFILSKNNIINYKKKKKNIKNK